MNKVKWEGVKIKALQDKILLLPSNYTQGKVKKWGKGTHNPYFMSH